MIAHVIVTYVGTRRDETNPSITEAERVKKLINYYIESFDKIATGGPPVDLLIVNNDGGDWVFRDWLAELNGKKFSWGKIVSWSRPNLGFSFGGYLEAYDRYKSDYDYWSFAEDDCILTANVFQECIDLINDREAEWPLWISFSPITFSDKKPHSGGGFGFTNTASLDAQNWDRTQFVISPTPDNPYPLWLSTCEINFTANFKLKHLETWQPFASNWKDHPGHVNWRKKYLPRYGQKYL